jgi:hypothetical protein
MVKMNTNADVVSSECVSEVSKFQLQIVDL